jgi:hypothetical protein
MQSKGKRMQFKLQLHSCVHKPQQLLSAVAAQHGLLSATAAGKINKILLPAARLRRIPL